jgi:predicted RecA/RadA family phage recombinase
MQNYVAPGNTLTLTAPYAVTSGQGALVGATFGVAKVALALGARGPFEVVGVYDLPKDGAAIGEGVRVYWDNTNRRCTATASTNTLIGIAAIARVAGDATVSVRLNGAF